MSFNKSYTKCKVNIFIGQTKHDEPIDPKLLAFLQVAPFNMKVKKTSK